MTIHKSKGLEFPVVICANSGNAGRKNSESDLPYYLSDKYDITFNLLKGRNTGVKENIFYREGREENEEKMNAETKRLLYVALTRAENHLVISGCHTKNNRNNPDVFLNMVLMSLGWEGGISPLETESLIPFIEEIPDRGKNSQFFLEKKKETDLGELSQRYSSAALISHIFKKTDFFATEICSMFTDTTQKHFRELPDLPSDRQLGDEYRENFGTLCHYIIEKKLSGIYRRELISDSVLRPFEKKDKKVLIDDAEKLADDFRFSAWERSSKDRQREMEFPLSADMRLTQSDPYFRNN